MTTEEFEKKVLLAAKYFYGEDGQCAHLRTESWLKSSAFYAGAAIAIEILNKREPQLDKQCSTGDKNAK